MSLGGWPVRVTQVVALVVLFASASAAFELVSRSADSSSDKVLFSASLDLITGKEAVEDHAQSSSQAAPAQQQPSGQQQFIIERIDFIGNRRIRTDTLKARIFSRDGDPYNEDTLRRDFQALWNTQFFEDVKLRVEDSPKRSNAKIIVFEVRERPQIRRIRYDGIHSISESDILDRFKERKVGLSVESQFDPTKIKKAEVVLKELLGEHGRQFAKVTPQYERIASSNAVILVFKIEEGPKVKVGKIKFKGNHAFSDRKLIRAMRHDRPYSIPLYFWNIPVLTKTYDREKLSEDLEVGIRELYRSNGYFKVSVGDPILENIDTTHARAGIPLVTGRAHGKAVNITIPIEEGERFRMGTLKIVSSDPDKALSLKVDALKAAFPLKQGDIFSTEKVRKALETYGKIYGEYGFIDFTPEPDSEVDDASKIINLTLRFDEQKQYYVRRIDFSGNTTTRDKVIRRELMIDEGQLFNKRLWELSILRLNQLDYFDKIEADKAAEIKRNTKAGTVDITLKLKEKGKQSIGLQGGVSGLAGSFVGLTYQTNNFLGLGETLTFSAQFGSLTRTFMFGFTEPYLFDRPISTGFTVFSSRYNFDQARQEAILFQQSVSINPQYVQNYVQNSTGFTLFAQYPLRKLSFARLGLNYGLTRTNIKSFNQASSLLFESLQFRSLTGPSALDGIISSTITPSISYNTVDNPINSTHGKSFYYSVGFSGLGGNVKTVTNVMDMKYFHPINKHRNVIGLHFSAAQTTGYAGKEVPPFSRFYMGGESDIRGYDIRAISPVTFIPEATVAPAQYKDPSCGGCTRAFTIPTLIYVATLPGGDLQSYGNVEYRIPIVGNIVQTSLFLDAGTVGVVRRDALQLNSAGFQNLLEPQNFPNAQLPLPFGAGLKQQLPIAPGTNFRLRGSTGIEFVVQLPIIQAPFRIYYAYNVNRLHDQLVAQNPYIDPSQICEPGNQQPLVPCPQGVTQGFYPRTLTSEEWASVKQSLQQLLNNPGRLNYFEPKTTFRFTVSRTF
ncbi:MAG TPA: outer membrane protein assembly factor BamA [Candidatus Acidoferrum sp.]|nr:outer membrane protein assembly factor BamA [Candidatus Acidoferrum sp.]